MGGVYDEKLMQRYIDMGARFILAGGDLGFLMDGAASVRNSCARPKHETESSTAYLRRRHHLRPVVAEVAERFFCQLNSLAL